MSPPNEYTTVTFFDGKRRKCEYILGQDLSPRDVGLPLWLEVISLNVSNLKIKMMFYIPKNSYGLVYAVVGGSVLLRQVFFLFSCLFLLLDYRGCNPCWAFIAAKAFSDITWRLIENKTPAEGSKLLHCLENDFVVSNRSVANICLETCVTFPNTYCMTWYPRNILPHTFISFKAQRPSAFNCLTSSLQKKKRCRGCGKIIGYAALVMLSRKSWM